MLLRDPCGSASSTKKPKRRLVSGKRRSSLVAGARYAQRCPVEFGLPMEAVIAA
jgi:hypothetical protein